MSIADEIHEQIANIRPIYELCRAQASQYEKYQSLEIVKRDCDFVRRQTEEKYEIAARRARVVSLQQRWHDLRPHPSRPTETFEISPDEFGVSPSITSIPVLDAHLIEPPRHRVLNHQIINQARSSLRRLMSGGLEWEWRLTIELQSHINRVINEKERLLGEALIMFEWSYYENRVGRHETDVEYLERLRQWGESLFEYNEQLERELRNLRNYYRDYLKYLDDWLKQGKDEAGAQVWQSNIETIEIEVRDLAQVLDHHSNDLQRSIEAEIARRVA